MDMDDLSKLFDPLNVSSNEWIIPTCEDLRLEVKEKNKQIEKLLDAHFNLLQIVNGKDFLKDIESKSCLSPISINFNADTFKDCTNIFDQNTQNSLIIIEDYNDNAFRQNSPKNITTQKKMDVNQLENNIKNRTSST